MKDFKRVTNLTAKSCAWAVFACVCLVTPPTAFSQQNTAGNMSVPLDEGDPGEYMTAETTIIAIYRGPGFFDESRMGTVGSGTKASFGVFGDSEDVNPDYTPPPIAPIDQAPDLTSLPEMDIPPPPPLPEEFKVEEISMPNMSSAPESPLPPPPSLESLTSPSGMPSSFAPAPDSNTEADPSSLDASTIAPPSPPVPPAPVAPVATDRGLDDGLPSLALPPPPSLDSIPPFEAD